LSTATAPVLVFLRTAVPMWVGTIFVVAGSVGAVASFGEWRAEQRFERDAVLAEGHVVATSLVAANREANARSRYLVTYRFPAADGGAVEQTEEIPVDEWEALTEGDAVAVRFLTDDPASARTRAAEPAWVGPLIVVALASFTLLGVAIALPYWRRALVLARLHRNGIAAYGTVVEVAPAGTTVNRVPQWHVRYEYRDERGAEQRGTSDLLDPAEAAEWRVGDRGAIRFDRERPSNSVWLGRHRA
jgi:hypothetical protein